METSFNIDELISRVTKEAIKEYDKEQRYKQKKNVYHNTRLLLKHYKDLKEHSEKAKFYIESEDIEEENEEDRAYILSIRRSKLRTIIMVSHIDMAMDTLKDKEYKLVSSEKYEALRMFYIEGVPYEQIVKHFNCGVNTPRRWINEMIKELSILLFGIDGLKLDMVK
ncbi:hypothetical protein [Clostridium algidicarnis]|uniref:hypothetical protein n=1 Tax=Clostridium algidicarnis TaxID=37659 RepID=UPI003FD8E0D5